VNPEKIRLELIRFGLVPPSFIRGIVEDDGSCVCVDESLLVILSLPDINEEEVQAFTNPAVIYYSRNEEGGVVTPVATLIFEGVVSVDVPFYVFSDALGKTSVDILLVDSASFQVKGYRKTTISESLLTQLQNDMKAVRYDRHYLDRIYDVFDTHTSEMLMEKALYSEVML